MERARKSRSMFSICLTFGIILGAITGLIGIYWVAVDYLDPAWGWTVFFIALFILLLWLPMLRVRKFSGGCASYARMLGTGSLVSLIATIVVGICLFFAVFAVNPDYVPKLRKFEIAQATAKLSKLEAAGIPTGQLEAALSDISGTLDGANFPWPWVLQESSETLFTGVFISLLLAICMRRKRREE